MYIHTIQSTYLIVNLITVFSGLEAKAGACCKRAMIGAVIAELVRPTSALMPAWILFSRGREDWSRGGSGWEHLGVRALVGGLWGLPPQ